MCNNPLKPPKKSVKKHNPSNGFSKSSRNPLKKNLIALGIINTTNTSPITHTLIFNLSFISIFISYYTTNIRNIIHITKEYLTFFSFISVSARPVLLLPPIHPTIYEISSTYPRKKHDNLSGRPELRYSQQI